MNTSTPIHIQEEELPVIELGTASEETRGGEGPPLETDIAGDPVSFG